MLKYQLSGFSSLTMANLTRRMGLLNIPVEIRLMIYEALPNQTACLEFAKLDNHGNSTSKFVLTTSSAQTAILATCRTINAEAKKIVEMKKANLVDRNFIVGPAPHIEADSEALLALNEAGFFEAIKKSYITKLLETIKSNDSDKNIQTGPGYYDTSRKYDIHFIEIEAIKGKLRSNIGDQLNAYKLITWDSPSKPAVIDPEQNIASIMRFIYWAGRMIVQQKHDISNPARMQELRELAQIPLVVTKTRLASIWPAMEEGVTEGKNALRFLLRFEKQNSVIRIQTWLHESAKTERSTNEGWAGASLMRLYSRPDEVHGKIPVQDE